MPTETYCDLPEIRQLSEMGSGSPRTYLCRNDLDLLDDTCGEGMEGVVVWMVEHSVADDVL